MSVNSMVGLLSLGIYVPNHVLYMIYFIILFVNYISIKLKK